MTHPPLAIEATGLAKSFGDTVAVSGVDLVAEGLSLQAAARIAALEDEVATLRRALDGQPPT